MTTLTKIDASRNWHRFYTIYVMRNLFGEWSVMREWGRIGSPGRVTLQSFASEEEARRAERVSLRLRERHGYK